tara:strand:- start:6936 stop:8444 length:1509 start_codon:yes stop_codon:yes gene_type:complete
MMELERIVEFHAQIDALEESGEEYERQVRRCYEAVLKPGDVAVDVGAYEGKHTIPLGFATAPEGRVYAAEPNIGIHEVLHGRIERSRSFGAQFEVFTGCVSNEGSEDVSFSVVPDKVGWSSLIPRRSVDNAEELLVQTLTMDSWVRKEDHPKVRFIKVDCEGAELKVLQGANAILAHHHAIVHLEISPDALEVHGVDIDDFATHLSEQYIALDCVGLVFNTPQELAAGFRSKGCFDFFFLSRNSSSLNGDMLALKQAMAKGFYGALADGSHPDLQLSLMRNLIEFDLSSEPTVWGKSTKVDFFQHTPATPVRPQESIIHTKKANSLRRQQRCSIDYGIRIVRTENFELLEQMPLPQRFDFDLSKDGHVEIDIRGEIPKLSSSNMTIIEVVFGENFVVLLRAKWWQGKKGWHLEGLCTGSSGFKQFLTVPMSGQSCEVRLIVKDHTLFVCTKADVHRVDLPIDSGTSKWHSVATSLGRRTRHINAEAFRGKLEATIFSPEELD